MRDTDPLYLEPKHVGQWVNCALWCAHEKNVRPARVQVGVVSTPPVAFMAIATVLDTKLPEKNNYNYFNNWEVVHMKSSVKKTGRRLDMESELTSWLRHRWTSRIRLLCPAAVQSVNSTLSVLYHVSSCHPCECHFCKLWSQEDELHHVGLGDQLWRWWWLLAFWTVRFRKVLRPMKT